MPASLAASRRCAGELLQADDDELGRFERGESDDDVDDPAVDVVLGGGLRVAPDEVGLTRRPALERTLAEQALQEGRDGGADLLPQRLVVRLEHHPLGTAEEALLQ